MKNIILFMAVAASSLSAWAQGSTHNYQLVADPKVKVDLFLSEHEVVGTNVYCRTDILTAECRTLILYRNKATGDMAKSFQIAFFAPTRQLGGSEFFLLQPGQTEVFNRLVDASLDGKVVVVQEEENQKVIVTDSEIKIVDIKFGLITATLTFNSKSAELDGLKEGAPVRISYPRFFH